MSIFNAINKRLEKLMVEKKKLAFFADPVGRNQAYQRFTGKSRTFKKNQRKGL